MTPPSRGQWLVGLLIAVTVGSATLYLTRPQPAIPPTSSGPDELSASEIRSVLEPDDIRAVDHPRFVSASRPGIRGNLPVIGVEIGGEAHAYPITYMSRVEIVNDRLGDTNIAVTW